MANDFNVGERVWITLAGKRRLTKIRGFMPDFGGEGILASIKVEGREYAVALGSLVKLATATRKRKPLTPE